MASTDLATLADATTAGYQEAWSYGLDGRYTVTLEKPLTGDPDGGSGQPTRAFGVGASLATAETQALAALNNKRGQRYGLNTGRTSTGKKNVNAHTRDVT